MARKHKSKTVSVQPDKLAQPPHHFRRTTLILSVAVLLVLAGDVTELAYLGNFTLGKVQAGTVALPKNTAGQMRVLQSAAAAYRFTLEYPDKTTHQYALSEAGIRVDASKTSADLQTAVKHLNWQRFAWWRTTTMPVATTVSNPQLQDFVAKYIAIAQQSATDAKVKLANGTPVIVDAKDGWAYALPGGNQSLHTAADTLAPYRATIVKTAVQPNINNPAAANTQDKINQYLTQPIHFILGSQTITPAAADIANWLDIQSQPTHHTIDVSVNSGKVQAYLDNVTAGNFYAPRSQIILTGSDGTAVTLASGQDGQGILNETAITTDVSKQLGSSQNPLTETLQIGHQHFGTVQATSYPKWIVVNVTTKQMNVYEHSTLVRTFPVSAGAPATPTVLGLYHIYAKYVSQTMRGANADGSRYFQPAVPYVNYFYSGYAIHGVYWHPLWWFGDINSSHGCVGVSVDNGKWIYDWAPIGTPVITHN